MGRKPELKSELGAERGTGPESPTDVAPERNSDSGMETEPEPGLERHLENRPENWGGRGDGIGDWGALRLPLGPEPIPATCREPSLELELLPVRESLRRRALCLVLGPRARVLSELLLLSLQT